MKITYGNKTGLIPKGVQNNEWWDDDANEVKNVVNANDSVEVGTVYPIALDRIQGRRYGTWGAPLTGDITVDTTNWVEGACAVVIWSGDTSPNITGATLQSYSGKIIEQGTYSIYLHYLNNRLNVNIFNVDGYTDVVATQYYIDIRKANAECIHLTGIKISNTFDIEVNIHKWKDTDSGGYFLGSSESSNNNGHLSFKNQNSPTLLCVATRDANGVIYQPTQVEASDGLPHSVRCKFISDTEMEIYLDGIYANTRTLTSFDFAANINDFAIGAFNIAGALGCDMELDSFSANGEFFPCNEGTGTTVTGSLGTVCTFVNSPLWVEQ